MKIKEMREKMGFTQREFGEYLHIPITNVSHWEQGVSQPPAYVLDLIERVLHLENKLD